MVANPMNKIDPFPNKSSRYLSLIGFIMVGFVLLYIANEQILIGKDVDQALLLIIERQTEDAKDRDQILTLVENFGDLFNASLDEINLTEVNYVELLNNKQRILDILDRQNYTHDGIDEIKLLLKQHVNKTS